jgi:hypothetical protein
MVRGKEMYMEIKRFIRYFHHNYCCELLPVCGIFRMEKISLQLEQRFYAVLRVLVSWFSDSMLLSMSRMYCEFYLWTVYFTTNKSGVPPEGRGTMYGN